MSLYIAGSLLAGMALFASLIWLTVVAFGRSVRWGLGVFFIPGLHMVFSMLHWEEARRPFWASLAALVALAACLFMIATERISASQVPLAVVQAPAAAPAPTPEPPAPGHARLKHPLLNSHAPNYVSYDVTVVQTDGQRVEGTLVSASPKQVVLSQPAPAPGKRAAQGSTQVKVPMPEIQELHVPDKRQ